METVTLGLTDLKVSRIPFGAWELGGEWGSFDENAAIATIRHARERGITLFDTAQTYGCGASEQILARALRDDLDGRRKEVVIATKGGLRMTANGLVRDSSRAWLRQGVDESLRALGVDYIDLYQVHWPDPNVALAETAGALEELFREGKIRHVGVSNVDVAELTEFAHTRPVETLQPPCSLFRRDIETDVLPYTRTHDIGVVVYGPLAHGLPTGSMDERTTFTPDDWRSTNPSFHGETFRHNLDKVRVVQPFAGEELRRSVAQLAEAWTLANPAVQVAIVGAQRAQHIDIAPWDDIACGLSSRIHAIAAEHAAHHTDRPRIPEPLSRRGLVRPRRGPNGFGVSGPDMREGRIRPVVSRSGRPRATTTDSGDSTSASRSYRDIMSSPELIAPPSTRPPAELPPEIEASWRYCTAIGLRPDHFAPPRDGDIDGDGAVLRAGHAVVERLGRDLHGTGVAVVLVDDRTRIVDRQPADEITRRRLDALRIAPGFAWRVDAVGTNALGMATSHRTSATVHGREHFMDVLTPLTTVAAPVSDPRTGQLSGALALVCAADVADVLLLAMARHGAQDIAQRLADGGTERQRLLNDTFRRHRRHTRGPLVLVNEETLLTDAIAAGTFTDGDRPLLWDMVRQAVGSDPAAPFVFTTRDGTSLTGSVKPVYEHGAMIAALVKFHAPGEPTARLARPSFGWDSLTPSEHGLIRLIADGLTNREAAARLYVSRHTIDSHLRHIFRKLGINSRVQLARIAASMSAPPTAVSA